MEKTSHKCRECRLKFNDIHDYVNHLESKDHVKGVMKHKYGEKYLEAKEKLLSKVETDKVEKKPAEKQAEEKPAKDKLVESSSDEDEDDDVYPCEVCKKVCTGYVSYRLHLEGKKHRKMVIKSKLAEKMKEDMVSPTESGHEPSLLQRLMPQQATFKCDVCHKACSGPEVYRQHCRSAAHLKKVAYKDLMKETENEVCQPALEDDEEPRSCDVCQKSFSGPLPYLQHMESDKHRKQLHRQQVEQFQCGECDKSFETAALLRVHLKSGSHAKQKRKDDLRKELEVTSPELVIREGVLGCCVCHRVFSGPEAASDHFSSEKHLKTVRRREQFRKFREGQKNEDDEDSDFDIIQGP